ncbi:hypothetical protein [Bradyrhizobium monzae]|uniref:hypothetical protein n=1 Tax=Bradyrhizobium sp. Oc8 TaxID=2876780 RepID=UPI001F3E32AE|nr:hypothetical protein [Bradyrhizobium sp. Oc8]
MNDDAGGRLELHLIKAFLGITDARKRQRILDLAEQLADDAASDTSGPAPTRNATVEDRREGPGRVD